MKNTARGYSDWLLLVDDANLFREDAAQEILSEDMRARIMESILNASGEFRYEADLEIPLQDIADKGHREGMGAVRMHVSGLEGRNTRPCHRSGIAPRTKPAAVQVAGAVVGPEAFCGGVRPEWICVGVRIS